MTINGFLVEELTRQRVEELRGESARLRTVRSARRMRDERWVRRRR